MLNTHGRRCGAGGETRSTGAGQPDFAVVPHLELAKNGNWQPPKQMKSKPSSNCFIESQTPDYLKLLDFGNASAFSCSPLLFINNPVSDKGSMPLFGCPSEDAQGTSISPALLVTPEPKGWILKECKGSVLICT